MPNEKALYVLPLSLLILLVSNSSAAKVDEPYKVVNEFCNGRSRNKEFCSKALKSDPRTASAKNNTDLLIVADGLAIGKTNETREFLADLAKKGEPKPPLKTALEDCISAYDVGLMELKIIPREMEDDVKLASYDAYLASDALYNCHESLDRNKINDLSISTRHNVATAYVELVKAIADSIR